MYFDSETDSETDTDSAGHLFSDYGSFGGKVKFID